MSKLNSNSTMRSCFVVWNNPEWDYTYKHDEEGNLVFDDDGRRIIIKKEPTVLNGMTQDEMCQYIVKTWCGTKKGRKAAAIYCVSAEGLHHIHIVFECGSNDGFRYTQVQSLFGEKFHAEYTRGNKKQVEDYIYKQGKFAEKGEEILAKYQSGELQGNQGVRSDLVAIGEMLDKGMTPNQILDLGISFIKNETLIRKAYFRKKEKATPTYRDVNVIWHSGASGSGKSFFMSQLIEEHGQDVVYKVTDYTNGFDNYNGEDYLFLEEFRGQLPYNVFLQLLDHYKMEIKARYTNPKALWKQVDIVSILTPDRIYKKMKEGQDIDKEDNDEQLFRRIHEFHYHYKDCNGEYRTYILRNANVNDRLRKLLEDVNWELILSEAIEYNELLEDCDEIL